MRPKIQAQAKDVRSSTTRDIPQLESPEAALTSKDCQAIPDVNEQAAMAAISEEEDERILDLEAEIEELREQV